MPIPSTPDRVRFDARDGVPVNAVGEVELTVDRDFADPWGELRIDVEFTDRAAGSGSFRRSGRGAGRGGPGTRRRSRGSTRTGSSRAGRAVSTTSRAS
jgi:hypothetical protein